MPGQADASIIADPEDSEILMNTFTVWCQQQGLKDDLVAKLVDEGFDDVKTVSLMKDEDVQALNIPQKGQLRLLQAAINVAVQEQKPDETPTQNNDSAAERPAQPRTVLPTGLSIDELFNQIPSSIHDNAALLKEPTFSRPEFDPAYHLVTGKSSSGINKPLDILDFIGISAKIEPEVERIVSDMGEGNSLILKTGGKKIKYESVTVWQWALGATRIFDELVRLGRLPSENSKRQYLGYLCKILELNSRFEWSSILQFDKEYRGQQACFNFPWGTEVPHLSSVQLKDKKPQFASNNNNKKGKFANQSHKGQSLVCRDFNRERCTRAQCKFLHQCSVDGCDKKHPATKHDDAKN